MIADFEAQCVLGGPGVAFSIARAAAVFVVGDVPISLSTPATPVGATRRWRAAGNPTREIVGCHILTVRAQARNPGLLGSSGCNFTVPTMPPFGLRAAPIAVICLHDAFIIAVHGIQAGVDLADQIGLGLVGRGTL